MIYHVSPNGSDRASGAADAPFQTIQHAANVARPGDTVQVHSGTYREWVDPPFGGSGEEARIVYEAAEGEHPVIKGSEVIAGWERETGSVWKKTLPNTMFGDWNPYEKAVEGDWLEYPTDRPAHLGDVYINGASMFEAHSKEEVLRAERRTVWAQNGLRYRTETILCPEQTVYQWYAEVGEDTTTLWCNFQEVDPNAALIEINVRKCCFYPTTAGVSYITLRGFEFAQAACPWNPPTGDQIGMVGVHWGKGWIIENNLLHDAKTSALSIGKDASTGDNLASRTGRKSGHRYQAEAVFLGLRMGWSKEKIGSHLIRNNEMYDCGQNGIVGHMGGAFCRIEHNHIYRIGTKHEFWGHELGGIKLHAAVDAVIENNNIHHCNLGTWLDWQAQGVRITKNLYHHNDRDLMIEVTHGPCTVDNNLFLSEFSLDNHAQGTAFAHNLFAGAMRMLTVMGRATPYHFPHSTEVAGYLPVYGGDDRVFNNLFLGRYAGRGEPQAIGNFSAMYDRFHTPDEYAARFQEWRLPLHDHERYVRLAQAVWINGNAYSGHAYPFRAEENATVASGMTADVEERDGEWLLTLRIPEAIAQAVSAPVTTERLGTPRVTEQPYENPDGTPIDFASDLLGEARGDAVKPGPFATLTAGETTIPVWKGSSH